jgi:rSAM/selenodomain-associated transferase 2
MTNPRLPDLSVVVPTLNAGKHLRRSLSALGPVSDYESVVVVDGGSDDDTREIAQSLGAKVVEAKRGRGHQLAEGARQTSSPWILFLHADTRLETGWRVAAADFMDDLANKDKAAAFRFALDSQARRARQIERFVAWRSRRLGLPYGDQGLLIHRSLYDAVGGYQLVPMLEDVGIVRKIGRKNLVLLEPAAVTSAVRFEAQGYAFQSMRNFLVLTLYFLGVPPAKLKRLYR